MNEIINRLTYRVQGTTISKDHLAFKGGHPTSDDWLPLSEVPAGGIKYTTVEWIGYDNDIGLGFRLKLAKQNWELEFFQTYWRNWNHLVGFLQTFPGFQGTFKLGNLGKEIKSIP